jgi:hypothetical protein
MLSTGQLVNAQELPVNEKCGKPQLPAFIFELANPYG